MSRIMPPHNCSCLEQFQEVSCDDCLLHLGRPYPFREELSATMLCYRLRKYEEQENRSTGNEDREGNKLFFQA